MATLAPQQLWTGRGSRWGRKFMDVLTQPRLMFRGVAVVSALFLAAGLVQEIGVVSALVVASMLAGVAGLVVAWRRTEGCERAREENNREKEPGEASRG